ncbi:phosphotransferase [Actinoplanes sp. NPDC051861]|uniref:phosphotransferase n=1 Tax=Actinoplanes sp. NPDC051861 TaxID=3155170 RepID=UPI00343C4250
MTQAQQVARAVATGVLGRDPGPMTRAESISHEVFVGDEAVVKVIGAGEHPRLEREIGLGPFLPAGLTAPLLSSGVHSIDGGEVRYACYARVPGAAPGMGLPGVDEVTACSLAEQAVRRLSLLHGWVPDGDASRILAERLDHGGFTGREGLLAEIEGVAVADRDGVVSPVLLDGLRGIGERASAYASREVPVHADCHWGNWLAADGILTALLDFEWARFGEPMDDWFFVIADSGEHVAAVLDVVAGLTSISPERLRAECEVREASYVTADIRLALTDPGAPGWLLPQRLARLNELIMERVWWRSGAGTRAI